MASIKDNVMEFGTRAGMGPLQLNRDGVCQVIFDGVHAVDIELRDGDVCFSGVVGAADNLEDEALRILLAANLLGDGTNGAALAIDNVQETVVLSRRLPFDDHPYWAFERTLTAFAEALAAWTAKLRELEGAVPADEATRAPASADDTDELIFRI